jgi:hypothetical protein
VHSFGNGFDDLVFKGNAQVIVGQQRKGPATLRRTAVEDDGAGVGNSDGATGDHPVAAFDLWVGGSMIPDEFKWLREPVDGNIVRDGDGLSISRV